MRTDSDSTSRAARVEVERVERAPAGPRPSTRPSGSRRGSRRRRAGSACAVAASRISSASSSPGRISPMPPIGMMESAAGTERRSGDGGERAARERGRDLGAAHHRVGDDRADAGRFDVAARAARRPRRSRARRRSRRTPRATPTHDTAMPSGAMRRSAGPFTGRAADDRADRDRPARGARRARRGCRARRGSGRSRSPGSTGRSRSRRRSAAPRARRARAGRARRRRSEPTTTGDSARSPTNHCCIASSSVWPPSRVTVMRVRTGSSVIGTQPAGRAPSARDLGGHLRERRPRVQALRAEEVGREVLVAEPEPGGDVVARERVERGEGLAFEAPALRGVRRAGERVGDRVEVGGDVQPVELVVVAGVDDRDDLVRRHGAHQSRRGNGRHRHRRREQRARPECSAGVLGRSSYRC